MAHSGLDDGFIQAQRTALEQTREELTRLRDGLTEDDQDRGEDQAYETSDRGDLGREIHTRQLDESVGDQIESRLENVERALEKIEEGSYGICDDTGEEIPKGRLEVMPEATTTVEAQQRRDERRSPGAGGAGGGNL
ncbi:TraR/DksA family transcriptional regulator [Rubrobacter aplysinae]|uniref:TraR/DksA family transcriptional regulator n=1 Tax=Rubrobacter aplysinae TaxID=909625 RepID=UPI00064BF6D2|nr:TraR/DksA C4-type zinc finger protein [Rubrobacter aplysinae]